jgi:type II secretion system protein G
MSKKFKAFTLIELLITLAIIAILVGIATPQVIGYINRGKIARAQMELTNIRSALQAYYNDWGEYPAKLTALRGTEAGELNLATNVSQTGLQGPIDYIEKDLPEDIFWTSSTDKSYKYSRNTNKTSFAIWSNGPNKAGLTTPEWNTDGSFKITSTGKDKDDIIITP